MLRDIVTLAAFIAFLAASFAIGYGLGTTGCTGRWQDSGLLYRYSFVGGCQVSPDGGRLWMSEEVYRKGMQ